MTRQTTLRYSKTSDRWRYAVRKIAHLGLACGVIATALWATVQSRPGVAALVATLTVLLAACVAYAEAYGGGMVR